MSAAQEREVLPLVSCRDCRHCQERVALSRHRVWFCDVLPQRSNLKSFPFMVHECVEFEPS